VVGWPAAGAAVGRVPQSITFGQPPGTTAGTSSSLSASASSGLTVSFTSGTPGVCTVSGSAVTAVAAGTCTITASQAGNADYAAAPPVARSFRAGPAAARKPVIVLAGVILAAAIAAGALAVRRRWLRPHPPPRPSVRAEPQAGPPDLVSVHATGADITHTVRIEPHPGATVMTTQEVRP
jgi:hypothetical protein